MSRWRRLTASSAVAILGASLAACSGGSNSNSASPSTTTSTAAAGTTSSTVSGVTTIPQKVPNQVHVRKDVTMVNCGATPDGWSAGGTVKNTAGHSATYHITVFFTSDQATDLAFASTSVAVNGGQTKLWSVAASFAAPTTVLCVLRGVADS